MSAAAELRLNRQTFTTSRELEYFTEKELVTQTGYSRQEWFPRVVLKELVDNALDAAEGAGVAPAVTITLDETALTISDNGPGIAPEVVVRTLDYSSRTSDKAAYVSPTRGAQGNALKTVLAIPYVLSGGASAPIEIDAKGKRHELAISMDHLERRPQVSVSTSEIVKSHGTVIRIPNCDPWLKSGEQDELFLLNRLVCDYKLFNPHASFTLITFGKECPFPATNPEWTKWLPSNPTSPHWYSVERLENLVLSYLSNERSGRTHRRTVREFCSEFCGLTGSAKTRQVIARAGLERAYLDDLLGPDGKLDRRVSFPHLTPQ
jgi:DNA topoisomerase VI subunit B